LTEELCEKTPCPPWSSS